MIDNKISDIAKKTLKTYTICDSCLGRLFRQVEYNSSNKKKVNLLEKT